ncbi:MAG TPA: Flp pilus assembly protein CpaB [Gemmatimonadales bacterium]
MANRRMRPFLVLLLALGSGALAAGMALQYLRTTSSSLMAESPKGRVAVASRDLSVGTVLTPTDISVVDWPGASLPAGYISSSELAAGRGLMRPMLANEPFLESKLAPKGAGGGLSVTIAEGMRAISVRVDEVVGVAGFVLPGTRVDVLLTIDRSGKGAGDPMTHALLQNIQTLAAGQEVQQDKDGKPKSVPVITLLVTPDQAETLTLAANSGRIQLSLRNTLDTMPTTTSGARLSGLFGEPAKPVSFAPRRVEVHAVSPVRDDSTVVEVYKGGSRSLLKF